LLLIGFKKHRKVLNNDFQVHDIRQLFPEIKNRKAL